MKESDFSADDLVKILSAFRDSGACVLKYRGLQLERSHISTLPVQDRLGARGEILEDEQKGPGQLAETPDSAPRQESPPEISLTTPEEDDEEDMDLLKIENPAEYERLLLKGDITDVGNDGG